MRDHLRLQINGESHSVGGRDAFLSLSDFLRRRLGLIGSKIVCSEGDCGACTVLIGRRDRETGRRSFRPIDSCIAFMFQLDGAHVVTVEGLAPAGELNGVQRAMVDCHGSQCGFCTPGFVVQMTSLRDQGRRLSEAQWRQGLTGNLCRCTGYAAIFEAGAASNDRDLTPVAQLFPDSQTSADLNGEFSGDIEVRTDSDDVDSLLVRCPATVAGAVEFLSEYPEAMIVAGATDVGVRINKTRRLPPAMLDLNRIDELDFVRVCDGAVEAGARASWAALEQAFETLAPEFHQILTRFGSPQIRHVGTIAGNIANASPIADALPFLFVTDATIGLQSVDGRRWVAITDFYHGYKQLELRPGELIVEVRIPLPSEQETVRLYKISRRRDLDISSFTAAIRMHIEAGKIVDARLAFGAVAPTVFRARDTEAFLAGKPFDEATLRAAGDIAVGEVSPITDVRGAADYRLQLTRNVLLKYFHQASSPTIPV